MTGAAYMLRNVVRRYGDSYRLQVPSLEIPAGKSFCILGPTGSGKSTLLRMLAGLEVPTSGNIWFDGVELSSFAGEPPVQIQRRITMVFQRPILLNMSVRANIEYGLRVRGEKADLSRVQRMLELFGLTGYADQSARTLSGGQAQLVALARALVLDVDVVLLDEPTANLDPARVALVERVLNNLRRRGDVTLVIATHNLFQARRLADRVGLLLGGELVEDCPVEKFFTSPADPRAAKFVQGKMIY